MNTEPQREFEQIHWLYHEFKDAIARGGVSHHTALDALEHTLEDLLADVCDSEENVNQYFEILRNRATRRWGRQNDVAAE
jgi:hypothetical protein